MPADTPKPTRFVLLETVLAHAGLPLQAMYTIADAARIFRVSPRAIQQRVQRGELNARNLPGRARFLSVDFEVYLESSSRKPAIAT